MTYIRQEITKIQYRAWWCWFVLSLWHPCDFAKHARQYKSSGTTSACETSARQVHTTNFVFLCACMCVRVGELVHCNSRCIQLVSRWVWDFTLRSLKNDRDFWRLACITRGCTWATNLNFGQTRKCYLRVCKFGYLSASKCNHWLFHNSIQFSRHDIKKLTRISTCSTGRIRNNWK